MEQQGLLLVLKKLNQLGLAGMENVQKAKDCRAMLIFNHVSYADGIILGAHFLPCGLAKASIADIPFFGTFARVYPHRQIPACNFWMLCGSDARYLSSRLHRWCPSLLVQRFVKMSLDLRHV